MIISVWPWYTESQNFSNIYAGWPQKWNLHCTCWNIDSSQAPPKQFASNTKVSLLLLPLTKSWPLWINTKSNFGSRVLGEVEKNSFIALPGKQRYRGLMPSKLCIPTWEDLVRSFIAMVMVEAGGGGGGHGGGAGRREAGKDQGVSSATTPLIWS